MGGLSHRWFHRPRHIEPNKTGPGRILKHLPESLLLLKKNSVIPGGHRQDRMMICKPGLDEQPAAGVGRPSQFGGVEKSVIHPFRRTKIRDMETGIRIRHRDTRSLSL